MATTPAGTTYVKTTSGSIITVVPKSLATLGGKIISTNIVSGNFMGEQAVKGGGGHRVFEFMLPKPLFFQVSVNDALSV